jgi:hypothetical protein
MVKPQHSVIDAIAGPGAIMRLLDDYVHSRKGTVMECAVGQIGEFYLVLVRVGEGPRVAMSVAEARHVARHCLATESMGADMREAVADHLADLARRLIELADDADAMAPGRLH